MEVWLPFVLGGGGLAGALGIWFTARAAKRRNTDLARREREMTIAERFDDASELAKYIREEVERQVAPIRAEMATLKRESHEMNDAVRALVTRQWMWDREGRAGALPMLPAPILERLNLGHLSADPNHS